MALAELVDELSRDVARAGALHQPPGQHPVRVAFDRDGQGGGDIVHVREQRLFAPSRDAVQILAQVVLQALGAGLLVLQPALVRDEGPTALGQSLVVPLAVTGVPILRAGALDALSWQTPVADGRQPVVGLEVHLELGMA